MTASVRDLLAIRCTALGLHLDDALLDRCARLATVQRADPLYLSLSKISSDEDFVDKHLLDALAVLALDLPALQAPADLVDLGTGAGYPALPLALALPHCCVHAVDAKVKAVGHLGRVAEQMGIANLRPRQARAEDLGRDSEWREQRHVVVARAVATVAVLAELCLPLMRPGGTLILFKGPDVAAEVAQATGAFTKLGVAETAVRVIHLAPPRLPVARSFVVITKTRPVQAAFPRRAGIPERKPLT